MGDTQQSGERVGERYELVARAPDRAGGKAWLAADTRRAGATVTLKFLRPVDGDALPAPLLHAVRALKAFRHDAVPTVLAHGIHGQTPWIVFDGLQGPSLGTLLDKARIAGEAVPLPLLREAMRCVAGAMAAAHAAALPLCAGSINPGAVIVPPKPVRGVSAWLLDLGLSAWLDPPDDAPATSARQLVTVAPEIAHGELTPRTDVFALAALATELLAMPAPLGATLVGVTAERRRDDVPMGVWSVLSRALSLSPAARFASVEAFAAAMEEAWRSDAAPARSRLAIAAAMASGNGSLLDTVTPQGPALAAPHAVAAAPQVDAPPAPALVLPTLPTAPAPPTTPTPTATRPRIADLVAALPTDADAENPWATQVRQRTGAPLPTGEPEMATLVASRKPAAARAAQPDTAPAATSHRPPAPTMPYPATAAEAPSTPPVEATRAIAAPTERPGSRLADMLARAAQSPDDESPHLATLVSAKPRGHVHAEEADPTLPAGQAVLRAPIGHAPIAPMNVATDTMIASVPQAYIPPPPVSVPTTASPPHIAPPAPPAGDAGVSGDTTSTAMRVTALVVVGVLVAVVAFLWGLR